jgi:RNA recognition motif-containing protein
VTEALQRLHALNVMGTSNLGALSGGLNFGNTLGALMLNPAASKLAREIYVGNLPPGITIPQLNEFLNAAMKQLLGSACSPQGSVIASWISTDARYAFVEMRTIEEANAALNKLNGLMIGANQLRIGRPKTTGPGGGGVVGAPAIPLGVGSILGDPMMSAQFPTAISSLVAPSIQQPSSDVIMISNLPAAIDAMQVKELISPFGMVRYYLLCNNSSSIFSLTKYYFIFHACRSKNLI